MFDQREFARNVAKYTDVQLARVLASAQDYTPEALQIVTEEWDRRSLTAASVAPAVAEAEIRAEKEALPDPTRSQTIRGIGFICYGKDYSPSVGYITTQWFCAFAIPLFPVRSFYVDQPAFGAKGIASEIRAHLPQVIRIYLFLVILILIASCVIWFGSSLADEHEYWAWVLVFPSVFMPALFVEVLRKRARRKRVTR